MTQQEKRIKIAERCGLSVSKNGKTHYVESYCWQPLPDYFSCLNACAEMEKILDDNIQDAGSLRYRYAGILYSICAPEQQPFRATASQRAEAFGITMSLWKEGE